MSWEKSLTYTFRSHRLANTQHVIMRPEIRTDQTLVLSDKHHIQRIEKKKNQNIYPLYPFIPLLVFTSPGFTTLKWKRKWLNLIHDLSSMADTLQNKSWERGHIFITALIVPAYVKILYAWVLKVCWSIKHPQTCANTKVFAEKMFRRNFNQ